MRISNEFYYRVRSSDKLEELYKFFNTNADNIIRNNPNIPIYAGEWIKIRQNDYLSYRVKPMDTIEMVANKYNVSVSSIIEKNDLKSSKLYIGQELKIYK